MPGVRSGKQVEVSFSTNVMSGGISETLWNEARLRWYGHVISRDEGELVRDVME